jgi:hypothetical protein
MNRPAGNLSPEAYWQKAMRSNAWATYTGLAHLILFFIFAILSVTDARTVAGVDNWHKPMKFASSIGIFMLTLSFLTPPLLEGGSENQRRRVRIASAIVALMMWGEMILISMQAARGTASHFNIHTPFDGAVYSVMGVMIATSTVATVAFLIPYFRRDATDLNLGRLTLMGIRWGSVLFILGSVAGGIMSGMLTHSVGEPGNAALPFLGWSLTAGDIRAVHFIGLHGLQVLPLVGLLGDSKRQLSPGSQVFIFLYSAGFLGATVLTVMGLSVVFWLA